VHCAAIIATTGCPCSKEKQERVQRRQLRRTNKSCVQLQGLPIRLQSLWQRGRSLTWTRGSSWFEYSRVFATEREVLYSRTILRGRGKVLLNFFGRNKACVCVKDLKGAEIGPSTPTHDAVARPPVVRVACRVARKWFR